MHHQDRFGVLGSFIHIMKPQAAAFPIRDHKVMGFKRKIRKSGKTFPRGCEALSCRHPYLHNSSFIIY